MGALLTELMPLILQFITASAGHVADPNKNASATQAAIEAETKELLKGTIETYQRITGKKIKLSEITARTDALEDDILDL